MGPMSLPRTVVCLIAVLAAGLVLRLYDLGSESLWFDEGITVSTVQAPMWDMLAAFSRSSSLTAGDRPSDLNPPLYHLLLHLWTRLFGDSEFSVRFPSVLFGLATIYLTYQIGRRLFNRNVGLLAGAMVALSLLQVRYSQEARMYTMMCMLSALSWLSLIKLEDDVRNRHRTMTYLIVNMLLTYTHVYGLFVVISQNLYFLLGRTVVGHDFPLSWRRWFGLQAILGVLYLPWSSVILRQILERRVSGFEAWLTTPSMNDLIATFVSYGGSVGISLCLAALLLLYVWSRFDIRMAHRTEIAPLVSDWVGWLNQHANFRICTLFVWICGVTLLPFLLSQINGFYAPRYTIASSIPFYILLSFVIYELRTIFATRVIICLLFAVYIFDSYEYYTMDNKERWREVVSDLETTANAGDLVIINNGELLHTNIDYYATRDDLIMTPFVDDSTRFSGNTRQLEADVDKLIGTHDRVWVVMSHPDQYADRLLAKFAHRWRVSESRKYFQTSFLIGKARLGVEVRLFTR